MAQPCAKRHAMARGCAQERLSHLLPFALQVFRGCRRRALRKQLGNQVLEDQGGDGGAPSRSSCGAVHHYNVYAASGAHRVDEQPVESGKVSRAASVALVGAVSIHLEAPAAQHEADLPRARCRQYLTPSAPPSRAVWTARERRTSTSWVHATGEPAVRAPPGAAGGSGRRPEAGGLTRGR